MSGAPSKCLLWFNGQKFDHCTCYGALGVNHDIPHTSLRIDSARNPCFERREKSFLDPSHSFGMTTRYFGHCDTVSRGGERRGGRTQPPPRPLPRSSTPSVLSI